MSSASDDYSRSVRDVQGLNINTLVTTFVQSNLGNPLVKAVISLLDKISAKVDLQRLMSQLLGTLTNRQFYDALFNALKTHVKDHPWTTAFFVVGLVIMCNPLAIAGFGASGPVAGSLAAAWQSTMGGTVAAGSAFAILQSWGMMYSVAIPVTGVVIAAGSAAVAAAGKQIGRAGQSTWIIATASGKEVERLCKGVCGRPVPEWWNGAYGDSVTRWWKGGYGAPVTGWTNAVVKSRRQTPE